MQSAQVAKNPRSYSQIKKTCRLTNSYLKVKYNILTKSSIKRQVPIRRTAIPADLMLTVQVSSS